MAAQCYHYSSQTPPGPLDCCSILKSTSLCLFWFELLEIVNELARRYFQNWKSPLFSFHLQNPMSASLDTKWLALSNIYICHFAQGKRLCLPRRPISHKVLGLCFCKLCKIYKFCKLCDSDFANRTDPSNHIVANHHQVALWKLHRAEKLLKILTLKRAIMIDVVASTETFSCTAKPKHEVPFKRFRTNSRMLQIGTTVPNSSRWTRRCRRRSRWRATRAAARPSTLLPALATRTLGEDQVQGEDTVPREESDCWPVEKETQIVNFILLYRQRRLLPQKSWCFAVWWNWD